MFYALSVDTWFNDKVSVFVALAPVTKLTHSTSSGHKFIANKNRNKQLDYLRGIEAVSVAYNRYYITGEMKSETLSFATSYR